MQRQRRKQHQNPVRNTGPVAVMPVRTERGAGARHRKVGAGDDAERTVERYGQDAAQRRQRAPHVRMLHQIGKVLVGGKAEPCRRAIDHGVHGGRERPAPRRDRDDDKNLDGLLGRRHAKYRMQQLCDPGVLGGLEDRVERCARNPQQRNAGGAEQKRGPDLGRRTGTFAGGDHQPQYQQRGGHRCGADNGRKGFKKVHLGQIHSLLFGHLSAWTWRDDVWSHHI